MFHHITSKDNAFYKRLRSALKDNTGYRQRGLIWIEGEHLCQAWIERGGHFKELVLLDALPDSTLQHWAKHAERVHTMGSSLLAGLSQMPSDPWILGGLVWDGEAPLDRHESVLVLDGIQDPANAGVMLRCAAAFGLTQVATTPGSVALWSPKVVRSAMGAHFSLKLSESVAVSTLIAMDLPVLVTDVHQGTYLHEQVASQGLPWPCMWVFGHEGQGVQASWALTSVQRIRIAQPGGQESLNVASAAAICLHASVIQRIEKC
jgi:TrmH family RNA methyltransferase